MVTIAEFPALVTGRGSVLEAVAMDAGPYPTHVSTATVKSTVKSYGEGIIRDSWMNQVEDDRWALNSRFAEDDVVESAVMTLSGADG